VERLPGPAWAAYLALGLGLAGIFLATFVASGTWKPEIVPLSTLVLYSVLNGLTPPYLLGMMHYLDESAAGALARFRPVLAVDDAGYQRLAYQLTMLPPHPTRIAAGLGAVYTVAMLLLDMATRSDPMPIAERPVVFGVGWGFNLLLYVLVVVLVYHTLHQLRVVNTIYTRHTRINLFQRGPLYALSSLTARTAIGIGIPTYVWFQADSVTSQGLDVPTIIQTVFLGGVMVVTFLWPLLGAHTLLEREKQRLQDEVGRRIEATLTALHQRADSGDLADFAAQRGLLDGLLTEQGVIDKLRTWPWRTETVSGLGLAFFLPVLIWVVQRVLERLGI
jgi:hypothetical protein